MLGNMESKLASLGIHGSIHTIEVINLTFQIKS